MILGYLIIGILLGTIGAAISLFLSSSVLLAFAIYSGVGSISVVLLAAFRCAQQTLIERKTEEHNATEPRWQSL